MLFARQGGRDISWPISNLTWPLRVSAASPLKLLLIIMQLAVYVHAY